MYKKPSVQPFVFYDMHHEWQSPIGSEASALASILSMFQWFSILYVFGSMGFIFSNSQRCRVVSRNICVGDCEVFAIHLKRKLYFVFPTNNMTKTIPSKGFFLFSKRPALPIINARRIVPPPPFPSSPDPASIHYA